MTSQKIYGRKLWLTIGGVDQAADMQEAVLSFEAADTDDMTFGDLAAGVADKAKLKIKAIQSTATSSFWRKVWEAAGSNVKFVLAPHGNETPSEDQPHITGDVFVGVRPDIGGAAGTKSYTFEVEWEGTADKALKTTATPGG